MKKTSALMLTFLFSIGLILVLHSICLKQNINVGDFDRNLMTVKLKEIRRINLPFECNSIIEVNKKYIVLNELGLTKILKLNFDTSNMTRLDLKHRDHNSNFVNDTLYSFDPYLKTIYRYSENLKKIDSFNLKFSFDRAIAIGNNSILFRASNKKNTKGVFKSYNLQNLQEKALPIRLNDSSIIDGGLSSDGFFALKKDGLIYTQYNKGAFYKIDTSLRAIKSFKTLDGISKIDEVKMTNDSSFYYSKPVLNVNMFSVINEEELFIVSFAKGKNDLLTNFMRYRTVDVYDINKGKYLRSFYLPNMNDEKARDIKICANKLYLLFKNKVVVYEI